MAAVLWALLPPLASAAAGSVACPPEGADFAPAPAQFDTTAGKPPPPPPPPAGAAKQRQLAAEGHQAETDWAGLCRYRAADRALQKAATPVRAVFMGDSITEFWAIADPALFTGQPGSRLLVNRGIGGQTSAQMLLRFRQDVIDLHPSAVHLLAGTNDVLALGGAVTLASVEGNIQSMVELAAAHGIAIVLGSLPPMAPPYANPTRAAAIKALNTWLRVYATQQVLGFADYNTALTDSHGSLNPSLSIDAVHPNRAGFDRMRSLVLAALRRAVR
jgi:lysophospholipase L1-like esterase